MFHEISGVIAIIKYAYGLIISFDFCKIFELINSILNSMYIQIGCYI